MTSRLATDEALHVRESNPERPRTIVWLHGGGVSGWAFREVIDRLPQYHHLAPDLPGHGQSAGPFTHADAAHAIASLIESRAHDGRAHLVGVSLGGQLALSVLASAPARIDRAMVSGVLAEPPFGTGMLNGAMGRALLKATLALYMPFRNAPWLVRANMRSLDVPAASFDAFAADTRALTTDAFLQVMTANMGFRPPAALAGVEVPTLVVVGQREQRVVQRSARRLGDTLPNARVLRVPAVGHNWNFERPALFADTVTRWLEDVPLDPALEPLAPSR